jgi:hypothetical protein
MLLYQVMRSSLSQRSTILPSRTVCLAGKQDYLLSRDTVRVWVGFPLRDFWVLELVYSGELSSKK